VSDKRALLLDLDGTLADSLGAMRDVYTQFLAGFGCEGTNAEFTALNGPPLPEVVRLLMERHRLPGSHGDLLEQYLALLDEVYSQVPAAPGAANLVRDACSAGWATVVVTSAPSALAHNWLRATGIEDSIDAVVGGEMVARGKPHPDPYIAGLAAVGADAARSLAVEDSQQGVTAALAAGVPTLYYRPDARARTESEEPIGVIAVVGHLDDVAGRLR